MIGCLQNKVEVLTKINEDLKFQMKSQSDKSKSFLSLKFPRQITISETGGKHEFRKSQKDVFDFKDLIERYEINDCKMKQLLIEKEDEISQLKINLTKQLEEENLKIKLIFKDHNLVKEKLNKQINDMQIEIDRKSLIIENLIASLNMKEKVNEKKEQISLNTNSEMQNFNHLNKFNSVETLNPSFQISFKDKTERNIKIESLNHQQYLCEICRRSFDSRKYISNSISKQKLKKGEEKNKHYSGFESKKYFSKTEKSNSITLANNRTMTNEYAKSKKLLTNSSTRKKFNF